MYYIYVFLNCAGTRAQSPQAWGRGHEVKGKLGVKVRLGGGIEGRELPLGRIHGGDGLAPDKEKPESEGLSWKNL